MEHLLGAALFALLYGAPVALAGYAGYLVLRCLRGLAHRLDR